MEYLTSFSNIQYTPAWYYKQFPGFYSIDSYKILAAWTGGCRTQEQYLKELELQQLPQNNDRKRKHDSDDPCENKTLECMIEDYDILDEHGIHAEFEREHPEDHPVLGHEDTWDLESSAV